jgi:dienelactone hydrolase
VVGADWELLGGASWQRDVLEVVRDFSGMLGFCWGAACCYNVWACQGRCVGCFQGFSPPSLHFQGPLCIG